MTRPLHDPAQTAVDRAATQVRTWLDGAQAARPTLGARVMSHALGRPGGLRYLTEVVDGVVRPEDPQVAATELRRAAGGAGEHLPGPLALAARAGAVAARVAPRLTVALARRAIRAMVGHLVIDARPQALGRSLARLREQGVDLNVNLLGEAVLGHQEAERRVEATRALIAHPDVDYVSIKVSAATAPHSPWDLDGAVEEIEASLMPLYAQARTSGGTFINLDMEEYRDLDLTLAVFERLMRREELLPVRAGIVLQAYLPESSEALERLQRLAAERAAAGGAPLRVRIVKGANLSMERVEADVRDWPLATWRSKVDSDAHYKRLLDAALDPASTPSLNVGIAGHNLFDVAHAWHIAQQRGITDDVQVEMLLGLAEHIAQAVAQDVGRLRLYTPVVDPQDFDVALAYLVRRLEEVANPQNFLSRLATMATSQEDFDREERAFREALERSRRAPEVDSFRRADAARTAGSNGTFRNQPDSDPARPDTRSWGREILAAARDSRAGVSTISRARIEDRDTLADLIGTVRDAGQAWGAVEPAERATLLENVATELERRRGALIEVMVAEAGKTIDQADPEVSEAVDFARYYAARARVLAHATGATPRPRHVTVVTPPWNFPVAIPAGSTLASLAAGSGVILKPAEEARRCSAVLAEALWAAGVPRELLALVDIDPERLGGALLGDDRVDQAILTGAYETAEVFLRERPDLRLHAETSGKNAMIITPSADVDLAVRDLVASAFGHAGQKCSAASLAILVGSVADSPRLHRQLRDAVTSLRVRPSTEPSAQMGPTITEPAGKLRRGLTELAPGETWWVEPRRLDDALWTPGVRGWVEPGTFFHTVECFGPALGVMRARDLDEAIALVNAIEYGLTSGLHTLDEAEMHRWCEGIEAGNLYINRGMTGAIVQRQPFGGWKRSVVGPTVKAGGPHYVASLTDWTRAGLSPDALAPVGDVRAEVAGIATAAGQTWVADACRADARAWAERFGVGHDPTGLASERNILRYRPAPAIVRWDGADADDLARVCCALALAGSPGWVSTPVALPEQLVDALAAAGLEVRVEADEVAVSTARERGMRVRAVGAVASAWRGHADLPVHDGVVTASPDLELTPFLREQAVSITAHRYGTPFDTADRLAERLRTGTVETPA